MDVNCFHNALVKKAREALKKYERIALCALGNAPDIALIKAMGELFSPADAIVMTADTQAVSPKQLKLVERACNIAGLRHMLVPVDVDFIFDTNSLEYKRVIFNSLLHEAWILGYETVFDGCTADNYFLNGNIAQHEMGVLSPLCDS